MDTEAPFPVSFSKDQTSIVQDLIKKQFEDLDEQIIQYITSLLYNRRSKGVIIDELDKFCGQPFDNSHFSEWVETSLANRFPYTEKKDSNNFEKKSDNDTKRTSNESKKIYKKKHDNVVFTVNLNTKPEDNEKEIPAKSKNKSKNIRTKNTAVEWEEPAAIAGKGKRKRGNYENEAEDFEEKKKIRKAEKCQFWPNCEKGDKCLYAHPNRICTKFPNCRFGDKCLYYHPAPAPIPQIPPYALQFPLFSPLPFQRAPVAPCTHGYSCRGRIKGCPFSHPPEPCRYKSRCTRKPCAFAHGAPCKWGVSCSRPSCTFTHISGLESNSEDTETLSSTLPSTPTKEELVDRETFENNE